jgi:hypothetical protein
MMFGAAPAITGVYNAGSWIPPALPNPVAFGNLPMSVSRALNHTVSWTAVHRSRR